MSHDSLLIFAAILYIVSASLLYRSIGKRSTSLQQASFGFALAGVVVHGYAQYTHWFAGAVPDVSVAPLLSLCALVIILLLLTSTLTEKRLFTAGLVALPLAAMVLALELVIPHQPFTLDKMSTGIAVHLVSSVLAFGLLSIAGLYAFFVFIIDYFLRRHHLNPVVRTLPPLEVLEHLLFQLITAGFLMLTISLGSGIIFINDIFAQHLVHKTVLSVLTWLVFGVLLFGRWRYGWRGSLAVRMTLAGVVLLILSYFGTKLVLEVILGRSWQS
ncbi:MAG: cytochrome c biogenesis protein CcsA [Xanthomonadales bacterium]|nr:cytochrome c biogenesis protein CcsA [Gammaproteobacteria bacterium]NNL05467.1 cytochrome c biogenesis protein CcsA [Xanthomonadales bacterium]